MDESFCSLLEIPERLWCKGRQTIDVLPEDDSLYRRFKVQSKLIDPQNKLVSTEIFEIKNDSFNIASLCSEEKDVLFNNEPFGSGNHYNNWGILKIKLSDISEPYVINDNGSQRECILIPKHKPVPCNYSHCELWMFINGEKIEKDKPRSAKSHFRRMLIKRMTILKEFNP